MMEISTAGADKGRNGGGRRVRRGCVRPDLALVLVAAMLVVSLTSGGLVAAHKAKSTLAINSNRRRAITVAAGAEDSSTSDNHPLSFFDRFVKPVLKKNKRFLQPYGRQGYKITNDSTETPEPTLSPTPRPTWKPTPRPTRKPTRAPTNKPTRKPTRAPTDRPTKKPTDKPTRAPTRKPTKAPTRAPTRKPTDKPTDKPTAKPTNKPTRAPTDGSTAKPTKKPSKAPTEKPTASPTESPVDFPDVVVPPEEISKDDEDTTDTDGDGISDADEIATGTDPFTPDDSNTSEGNDGDDNDGDEEPSAGGTTEESGIIDREPIDSDGDGISDADEIAAGTDPNVPDTTNTLASGDDENDGSGNDGEDQPNDDSAVTRTVDVEVPVPEFSLGLEYPEEVTVNNVFRNIIDDDLRDVLTGYLNQELDAAINTGDREDGLVFEGVELTVAAGERRQRRLLRVVQHQQRATQEKEDQSPNVAKFDVGGTVKLKAQTDAPEGGEDDAEMQQKIQDEVDAAVRAAVADEEKMMAYIREHADEKLLQALEGVKEPTFAADRDSGNVGMFTDAPPNESNNKGASMGQIIGFALVGVMAAGLLATGFVLYKRRQYQRRHAVEIADSDADDGKARDVVPVTTTDDLDSEGANDNTSPLGRRLIPFGDKKRTEGDATQEGDDLSSSSEDYGLDDGGRSDDDDTFARELQAAATTDKRAWEELDSLKQRAAVMNKDVAAIPPPSRDVPAVEHEGDGLDPIHEGDDGMAVAAAAGLAGAAGAAAVATSRQSGRKSPIESLRGLFGSSKQSSDHNNVLDGSDAGGPPSDVSGGWDSGGRLNGPPSESSGGWPAGNAATVASILAATQMPNAQGDPASSMNGGTDMAVGSRGSLAVDQDGDGFVAPDALQEFQSVKRFVNDYESKKVRVDDVDDRELPADDDMLPHSETMEDKEFLAMGMQSFYANEQTETRMYPPAGAAVVGGAAAASAAGATAGRGAGADPPGASGHPAASYEDDETIGSSVMSESIGPDGRRLGITPYGEQKKHDRPNNMVPVEQQESYDTADFLGDANAASRTIPIHEQQQGNDRLGINTFSELKKQEGHANRNGNAVSRTIPINEKQQGDDRLGINTFSELKKQDGPVPVQQVNVSSPSRKTSSFFPKSKPVTVVESPKASLNTTLDTAPISPSPTKGPNPLDSSGEESMTELRTRAKEMIDMFEEKAQGEVLYPPNESWQHTGLGSTLDK